MTTTAAPAQRVATATPVVAEATLVTSVAGRRMLAVLRYAVGFIFLWAFFDKTFGLGFSTLSKGAWIHGGSPSSGFLKFGTVGPLKGFFASLASVPVDILFMLGMLGVGAAVMLGIGVRVSAVVGSFILLLMYLAEWPFGANAASTNPIVDYHIIFALSLIVIAILSAGDTWGFGKTWKSLPIVKNNRWLI